jgi:hypothetical protein
MGKKNKAEKQKGKYYFQGESDEEHNKFIKNLLKKGYTVYHQYGVPGTGCGPGGCI